jgi:hypothetical protein
VLASAIEKRFPFASSLRRKWRKPELIFIFTIVTRRERACETAKSSQPASFAARRFDAARFQDSTAKLANCFPNATKVESKPI